MAPQQDELDDEIRGHMALSIKERIDRGEDPEAARLAALKEFGNVTLTRESIRAVWRPRVFDSIDALWHDIRIAMRSLARVKGLAITVALTLALGIGANAAIFSVVRQVLLRPLVNRDEDRLVYIRQTALGHSAANTHFSVPELDDLKARAKTVAGFGDFSTIEFTLVGLGEPRVVQSGVVGGTYFDVMGLRPVLGRLINASDDGPQADGVAVLTYRFWHTTLNRDASVVGKTIRLGSRTATVIGVLEPSIPYPADTEIIANIVTSPHHLGATMVTQRTHRMTELFGRLAPGASIDDARAELTAIHTAMLRDHPDAYTPQANMQLSVTPLRDQITSPARTVLWLLLASAGIVFVIACSNVTNLILARTVRREGELAIRAALGAGTRALRRTLLAESLVLCGSGAILGVLLARPMVNIVGRYAARFSVRALDVTVDPSLLWVGAGLAMLAAVVLAYVPRLPPLDYRSGRPEQRRRASAYAPAGPAMGGVRITAGTNRRLRLFAVTQIALSFLLLAGAGMILSALIEVQNARTGYEMHQVLAIDVPLPIESFGPKAVAFFDQATRRIKAVPGVERVAAGNFVPWRDAGGTFAGNVSFAADGYTPADGEEDPRARLRNVTPGFFGALGISIVEGRDFTAEDRANSEPVVVVSQAVAQRLFPNGNALNHHMWWTDPYFGKPVPRRIVGIASDVDDENVVPKATMAIYHPLSQLPFAGRLFVQTAGDPYALVAPVTRIIREISADQPVERAATLADVRAEVLAPERLNAFVFSGFAGIALLIAVVGVAGVLAFSVSARTREFGVRLAIGSAPRHLLARVLSEGVWIAALGIGAGVVGAYAIGGVAVSYLEHLHLPSVAAALGAATVLMAAAVIASLTPAARASRVDVVKALRSE